jgi:alpha-ribazole phosphatase/probable phosphoglycerate mutase
MKITRLYLIRHGQVVNHHELRYTGHTDVDITNLGVQQMENLADALSGTEITAVYSSDLTRAVKGAEIIAERLNLKAKKVHAFRELYLGRWEGLTREEGVARFPDEADFRYRDLATTRIKGGENLQDLRNRVIPVLNTTLKEHHGEHICMVVHGGVNRVILCDAMGLPLENFFRIEQDYGCMNVIEYFEDGIKVIKLLNGGPNQELRVTKIY